MFKISGLTYRQSLILLDAMAHIDNRVIIIKFHRARGFNDAAS